METGGKGTSELAVRFRNRYSNLQENKLDVGMNLPFLKELERVCKYIYIYIWCNKNLLFQLINYYSQREDVLLDLITWGKTNPMPLCNNHFLNDTEYCLCIHEKGVMWNTNAGAKVKRKCYMTSVNKEDKDNFGHPTIKPIEIIQNFILNSSKEDDIVFDPFMGSGTTCVAAKRLNRKYIGFEIEEKWFNVAKDRLQGINQKGEMNLFDVDYGD
jgi:DNA modification methylase